MCWIYESHQFFYFVFVCYDVSCYNVAMSSVAWWHHCITGGSHRVWSSLGRGLTAANLPPANGERHLRTCDLVTQWGSPHHCTRPTLLTMLNIYKRYFFNLTSIFGWDMSMNMGTWACNTLPNSASFLINHCPKLLSVPLHDLNSSSLNSYWMMHVLIVISI